MEKGIELDSIELAAAIFGNRDENIRLLEQAFHVTAVCRGSTLKFTGEPEDVDAAIPRWRNRRCATASAWPAAARKNA